MADAPLTYESDIDETGANEDKYLLFAIGEETYAIDISQITEIIEMQKITDVPDMPDYVKGVINLRGRVVPVVDFRMRIGMVERAYDDRTCMIIVDIEGTSLGFIVDTVAEVHDIIEKDIDPPPEFNTQAADYIFGLGKVDEKVVIMIDARSIVNDHTVAMIELQA